jgi:hypothetical protein
MEPDRGLRRLTSLEQTASSARVLNLLATHRRSPRDMELQHNPMFRNRILNRSIILKHRLRPDEYASFTQPRPTVTKVMIPIDGTDLRAGAHSFFLGQIGFESIAEHTFGEDMRPGSRDRQVLELIDALPSLDPFLLREQLRKNGFEPARGYFSISDADMQRMVAFVRDEIMALVVLSTGSEAGAQQAAGRMVEKLLSNTPDGGFEPLKHTLGLSDQKYMDGVFSWRGFIYYKWQFLDLSRSLNSCMTDIRGVRGEGSKSIDSANYIEAAKLRILEKLRRAHVSVQGLLNVYNSAYRQLTQENNPVAFRDFLLAGPDMFLKIGEQLGAMQHVISFWNYRMPKGRPRRASYDELADLFQDFEDGLSNVTAAAPRSSVA